MFDFYNKYFKQDYTLALYTHKKNFDLTFKIIM